MQLPGRLRATSLGDLLGTLHRAAVSGALELVESRGRLHRIYWTNGQVSAVELDGVDASLGERLRAAGVSEDVLRRSLLRALASRRLHGDVLMNDFQIDPNAVMHALHAQLKERLAILEKLDDAQLFFRVQIRPPRSVLNDAPLAPETFLHGRSRARDRRWREARVEGRSPHSHSSRSERAERITIGCDRRYAALGLTEDASFADVKRTYRNLVRTCHPDLHPMASESERAVLVARFREITEAYRALEAASG